MKSGNEYFKYLIVGIILFGFFVYLLYDYFQNHRIDIGLGIFIFIFIIVFIIILIIACVFYSIKKYSLKKRLSWDSWKGVQWLKYNKLKNAKCDSGNDSFKFAIASLTLFGSLLYTTYNFFQNHAIGIDLYAYICYLFSIALIPMIGIIIYLLLSGYSLEVRDCDRFKFQKLLASRIYLLSFIIFTLLLVFISLIFYIVVWGNIAIIGLNDNIVIAVITAITLIICMVFQWPISKKNRFHVVLSLLVLIVIVSLIWSPIPQYILKSPLQGHVEVDMKQIYYKNGAPIPVSIQVTGPNTGLLINLSQIKSNILVPKEYLLLRLQHNNNINSSRILVGNKLGSGKYTVYINTTTLDAGYYELNCTRSNYSGSIRSFYLVDNTQQPANNQIANTTNVALLVG